ncbi:MAG: Gfo/Idh/MocA family protein [Alkalispirochaetaceae bacterium]
MERIKLGIIGPGLIWDKTHRDIVRSMGNTFEVTALSARSEKTREKARGQFPQAEIYPDYRDLIKSSDVEAVVVLTPIPLNAPVTLEVLAAGKHAIVEKPMATSVEEGSEVIEAEKKSNGNVYILEQFPHKTIIPEVKAILEERLLGRTLHFEQLVHNQLREAREGEPISWGDTAWRQETAFPLGNIFDGGIHQLAMLQMIFGPPRSVVSVGSNLRPAFGEYDTISSLFRYGKGLIGSFSHSGYLPAVKNYLIIRGDRGAAEIGDNEIVIHYADGGEEERRVAYENESARMWREIGSCIAAGTRAHYSSERTLLDLQLLEAIEKSLKEQRQVDLSE